MSFIGLCLCFLVSFLSFLGLFFLHLSFCFKLLVSLYFLTFLSSWSLGNPQNSIFIKSHGSSQCGELPSMTAQLKCKSIQEQNTFDSFTTGLHSLTAWAAASSRDT